MSDQHIFKLFNDYASDCTDTAQFAMDRYAFAAALREALAEEMAEAVRLLGPKANIGKRAEMMPPKPEGDFNSWIVNVPDTVGDCRAAARFVAEHGKAITPPSSPPPIAPGTTPSTSPSA